MRAKHWIVVALFVAVVASTQAYALTMDKEPEVAPQTAEVEAPRRAALGTERVVSQVAPEVPVAPALPDGETLIVGFQKNLSSELMEAIVRAAGATPASTVPAPGTLVVSVDDADRDATVAQLESHLLVDYVAVPAGPRATSSL